MNKLAILAVTAMLVAAAGCNNDPVCGNKVVEKGEGCDKGELNGQASSGCSSSCQLQNIDSASVQVFYSRLKDEVPGFSSASCLALGIKEAHVRLEGPTASNDVWPCDQNSKTFNSVAAGEYQAFITLYDMNGTALTKEVASPKMSVAIPGSVNLVINFAYADFLAPNYTGSYYFLPSWGTKGTRCAAASVDKMEVTITPPGSSTPITGTTTPTVPLDGTATACFSDSSTMSFIKIATLPTGHYDMKLVGLDAAAAINYCKKFDIFVGPGAGTPTFDLVVDAATACP